MKTIDKIINKVNCRRGAPMGRHGKTPKGAEFFVDENNGFLYMKHEGKVQRVYDCFVPMSSDGAYDKGGAYWGLGKRLRVQYTKDLSYISYYRQDLSNSLKEAS